MKILHIGGVADGEQLEIQGNVMASRHSFKRIGDFPADALHHHDYSRGIYGLKASDAQPAETVQLMVMEGLPKPVEIALIEARLGRKVETDFPEAN